MNAKLVLKDIEKELAEYYGSDIAYYPDTSEKFKIIADELKEGALAKANLEMLEYKYKLLKEEKDQLKFKYHDLQNKYDYEHNVLEIIKKAFNSSSVYTNKLKDSYECGWITETEFNLIKEWLNQ